MTEAFRTIDTGDVAIRDDADGDGRTVYGYAYRWGELTDPGATAEFGTLAEGFERGAFAEWIAQRAGRPSPMLDRHRGTTIAGIVYSEDDTGLAYTGRLLDTQAARDYAASVPAGNDGVSLEFQHRGAQSKRTRSTIIHTKIPRIGALAGVYAGAYQGASVALRSETGGTSVPEIIEQPDTPAEPASAPVPALNAEQIQHLAVDAATEAFRSWAERGSLALSEADPYAGYRSLGELFVAARATPHGDPLRAYAARALAYTAERALDNSVFTSGANAGLASGNLITGTVQRIVNAGRPAITAFGGPRGLGDTAGLTLEWPYFDGTLSDFVGAQSAEKAEITSASMDIKLGTEALVTYAGGTDMSYQLIRRGSPSAIDALAQILLAAWSAVTDAAFVTELETGTATIDFAEALTSHDLTEFIANVVDGSVTIQAASGAPAEFILASSTAFAHYAKLIAASSTTVVTQGGLDLTGLRVDIGGVPLIHTPSVTAGKVIISNRSAAAWYEDGPFQASAEDVTRLGRDIAFWSMGAGARFNPAAILEAYDVTP